MHRVVPKTDLRVYDDLTPLSDADMAAAARALLVRNEGRPFWVFGYGSLIWKPAFEHVEARRVVAHGWRRSFCLEIESWRATPEEPGLMLALVTGGSCAGMAYRMPSDDAPGRMLRLLKREVSYHQDLTLVRWITVRSSQGPIRALVFYAGPPGDPYFRTLSLEDQARRLALAVGYIGSCAEYLHNTVRHLEEIGIRDRYLWRLQQMVAAEIEAAFPFPIEGAPLSSTAPR